MSIDYTLLVAVIVASIYLLGLRLRQSLRKQESIASSCGGGIAAAYVFLQLFPGIVASHEWLGDSIHFVILISFLVFFAVEQFLWKRAEAGSGRRQAYLFWMHITLAWIYTWTIVFALPQDMAESFTLAVLGGAAIGLHLLYKDYVLRTHHASEFESAGRYSLALAPLAGWFVRSFTTHSDAVFALSMALLSGFLFQNVFRYELPSYVSFRYRWFLVGVTVYALLVLLTP